VAIPSLITTGEQSVTATGAITGSLNTSALVAGVGALKVRIRGLTSGQSCRIAVEDTANASAFSDAIQVFVVESVTGHSSTLLIDLPDMRFGVANSKLRLNCQAITASTTALVQGWIEQ
jgi:ammonia channel protein AmtB